MYKARVAKVTSSLFLPFLASSAFFCLVVFSLGLLFASFCLIFLAFLVFFVPFEPFGFPGQSFWLLGLFTCCLALLWLLAFYMALRPFFALPYFGFWLFLWLFCLFFMPCLIFGFWLFWLLAFRCLAFFWLFGFFLPFDQLPT